MERAKSEGLGQPKSLPIPSGDWLENSSGTSMVSSVELSAKLRLVREQNVHGPKPGISRGGRS